MSFNISPLGSKELPLAPPFRKLFGPSFILLGLGLGSGEVVLWPYMASNYGLGIVWGMLIGITMQFFINMEIARYALVNGESIFVGFARALRWLPAWFIVSTLLGFGWPGIGLYGASLLSTAVKPILEIQPNMIGIILFVSIGLILSLGKALYQTVEQLQKYLIGVSIPFIVGLTYYLATSDDVLALTKGLAGVGSASGVSYYFLPPGIAFGTFLGALAYAGAGGNLNLTQSCYVRDKGYGMGKYAQGITSLITAGGASDAFKITGNTFPVTPDNLIRFRQWWKIINWEHFLIFWALGLFTMLTLSLLAYITTFGQSGNAAGINFIAVEAISIGQATIPILGTAFLVIAGLMLCATQLTVLDSTTRIITENLLLLKSGQKLFGLSKTYYLVLWSQILFGVSVFSLGFDQPLQLIILGAVINAFSMFVYTGILLWLNNRLLENEVRPAVWRNLALVATLFFFGTFCVVTAYIEFNRV
jgi:hypothetical protein